MTTFHKGEPINSNYHYQDTADTATCAFIGQKSDWGYWGKSEKHVLANVKRKIRNLPRIKSQPLRMIDAGCGCGRLILEFAKYFDEIVAVEPDPARLAVAQTAVKKAGLEYKVRFVQCFTEDLKEDGKFDFVLSSHIIQHVHTRKVSSVLGALAKNLAPKGLLVLMTSHLTKPRRKFVKCFVNARGVACEPHIKKDEFNSLVKNSKGALPVHAFTASNLTEMFASVGLSTVGTRVFHCMEEDSPLYASLEGDETVNADPKLKNEHGRDIIIMAQHAKPVL